MVIPPTEVRAWRLQIFVVVWTALKFLKKKSAKQIAHICIILKTLFSAFLNQVILSRSIWVGSQPPLSLNGVEWQVRIFDSARKLKIGKQNYFLQILLILNLGSCDPNHLFRRDYWILYPFYCTRLKKILIKISNRHLSYYRRSWYGYWSHRPHAAFTVRKMRIYLIRKCKSTIGRPICFLRVQSNFKNEIWVQNSLTLLREHKVCSVMNHQDSCDTSAKAAFH